MSERDDMELLMARVDEMRQAQKDHERFKTDTWKKKKQVKEGILDEVFYQLKRKGYDPNRFKTNQQSNEIF